MIPLMIDILLLLFLLYTTGAFLSWWTFFGVPISTRL
jgi:hypothetical protein